MSRVFRLVCHCERCHHEWIARSANPVHCPACKQRGWDKELHETSKYAIGLHENPHSLEARCSCGWAVRFAPYNSISSQMADEAIHNHHEKMFGSKRVSNA